VKLPTLVPQCSDDPIAPDCVGEYVHATLLRPGDMVVLYTDGVSEARQEGSFFGEAGVAEVAGASAGRSAQAVADAVVAAALDFQHGPARDDIAVVVVKVPPAGRS
jgi:serine phosphatase RsbU (regulator of sigma subunit)